MGLAVAACLVLANCAASDKFASRIDPRYGVSSSPRVIEPGQPVPKGGGAYRVGKPYLVAGRMYVPEEDVNYRAEGLASWYGDDFHGRLTANGEVYDMHSISAAHPTLPMPSYVRVTNLANKKSIIVRVNDRGPYHSNRIIDLSATTAHALAFRGHGVARVRVEYIGRAPLEGSDDAMLMATLRDGMPAPPPSLVMLASAKPFVPHGRQRYASIDSVPMPPERPYTLGEPQAETAIERPSVERPPAARPAVGQRRAAHDNGTVSTAMVEESDFSPRGWWQPQERVTSQASAFAPARLEPSSSVMSGRGLY
ncbi:septal ring lytic transglycosylase RlpA family protein [Xanthobacteraceae bacterium Astr-EGSB]|uniref:septal ring lytic transglycosylase RlpA family protein n=1 Tax=Astrobacterium formosum TaxID=3069710 RepID=UPI0027AFA74A|nr:septal ring lytic transglycosylase RlpA family protein [Xanthobacteraceae bacterium Astr-EGSB]